MIAILLEAVVPVQMSLLIDDDVLVAAQAQAERQGASIGEVMSAMARKSLRGLESGERSAAGVLLIPRRPDGGPVTSEDVSRLRDEEE